jgi:PTS system mannose-specific IIA component
MIGCIVVAHGNIAQAFLDAAQAICGPLEAARAVGIETAADEHELFRRLSEAIKEVGRGEGVVIFTDIFGGTPSNVCFSLLQDPGVEVVTGTNLPMLVKFLTSREGASLKEIVRVVVGCGREDICSARDLLEKGKG